MYEYKFVKIDLKTGFTTRKPIEDYHIIIDHYAAKGCRLVQIFAPPTLRRGEAEYFELIFEKHIYDD